MKKPLRIIFFGTPAFAVESLKAIHQQGHEIAAVITAPDKPAGRGKKLRESEVKKYAKTHGLPLLQPVKLKSIELVEELKALNPDVGVVVAFRILPRKVFEIPRFGTFNLHASLLPDYRGAAPINHAIINGETQTGVTTFFIDDHIDTGSILMQKSVEIHPDDNAGSLHDRLMKEGAQLVIKTLEAIAENNIIPQPQDHTKVLHKAPKLTKENTRIDWTLPGQQIRNFIRGLSPYPGAWTITRFQNNREKRSFIYDACFIPVTHSLVPGQAIYDQKTVKIAAKDGFIIPHSIKFEGKKQIDNLELFNGTQSNKIKIFY